jgi:hypothetical protein
LLYWGALAHARAGATSLAHALLDRCDISSLSPALRGEALSLRGRLWKDAFHRGGVDASRLLANARAEYRQAYAIAREPYPGINAASLAMLAGDRGAAVDLARDVASALPRSCESVWDLATRAEAHLLVGDLDAAARDYAEACARAEGQAGVVASMRRQLALLSRALPQAADLQPLPVRIWSAIRFGLSPTINAIGTLMMVVSLATIALAVALPRLFGRRESGFKVLTAAEG